MSDNFFRYLPRAEDWIPTSQATVDQAVAMLAELYPDSENVSASLEENTQFFDCGDMLESITCPRCRADLMEAWGDMMDSAFQENQAFIALDVQVPCCGATVSLNDLIYDAHCAFARFAISIFNPTAPENPEALGYLRNAFETDFTVVHCHI